MEVTVHAWLLTLAWADPPSTPSGDEDDWGFRTESGTAIDPDDDDPEMTDFVAAEKRKPAPSTHSHLYPQSKRPFTDDWPLHVVSTNEQFVVLELPVLVAHDRAAFLRAHPHGVLLVGHWLSGPHNMTVRQEIRPNDVLAAGPTFAFLKAAIPNRKAADQVRVVVRTAELPGPPVEGEPPVEPPALKTRYAQTTVYSR